MVFIAFTAVTFASYDLVATSYPSFPLPCLCWGINIAKFIGVGMVRLINKLKRFVIFHNLGYFYALILFLCIKTEKLSRITTIFRNRARRFQSLLYRHLLYFGYDIHLKRWAVSAELAMLRLDKNDILSSSSIRTVLIFENSSDSFLTMYSLDLHTV